MEYALKKRAQEYDEELINLLPSYLDWVFYNRYYPDGLLPASFQVKDITLGNSPMLTSNETWRLPLKISPPDDRLTSAYFGIYHPDALHDFFLVLKKLDLKILFRQSERITSYSLPLPSRVDDNERIRGVSDYLRLETDLSSDAHDFNVLIKLDIKHCYPSIYSHSLHWAIDGYEKVRKEDKAKLTVKLVCLGGFGDEVDGKIQAMHGGITKGLTVGPGASDIIAEILLRQIDREISKIFESDGVFAYGARYKDDYRILVKDDKHKLMAIDIIEKVLKKYLLHLNDEKTSFGQPFELLQRDWMVEYHSILLNEGESKTQKQFLWHLAHVSDLQRKYPGKRLLAKYLSKSNYRPESEEDMCQIASVLLSLSDVFRSAVPYAVSYIEKSAENIKGHNIHNYILNKIKSENNAYNAIWYLHFLTNYLDDYKKQLGSDFENRFSDNPFIKSLFYQSDHVFASRALVGDFFVSTIGKKIYEQTRKFADLY